MLFGSVARGIKTGGFNGTATLEKNLNYGQDENWTYEVGSRNTFADGKAQFNATLFYITWSDLQIRATDEGNPAPLPVTITKNVGDVTSYGVEMDAAFAASDNLTLYGTLYLGDSTFDEGTIDDNWGRLPSVCDDVVCPINGDLSGNQLNNQPDTQASIGFDWQHQLTGDFDYYVRADVSYQSKIYADSMNLATLPDRTLVNASFGFFNDRYSVQLWARNLTDEEYISSARMQSPNLAWNAYLGERRTIGVTATVNWQP
jgi:iron complex outermembrane receptor protein